MIFKKCFLSVILASMLLIPTVQKPIESLEVIGICAALCIYASFGYGCYKGYEKIKEYKACKKENIEIKAENAELKNKIIQLTSKVDENKNEVAANEPGEVSQKDQFISLAKATNT